MHIVVIRKELALKLEAITLELKKLRTKSIVFVTITSILSIIIDYALTSIIYINLYDSSHGLEIGVCGSLVILAIIKMTEKFLFLLNNNSIS